MPDYERERAVETTAGRVYELLSDVRNLPWYFPGITSATPVDGGDAVHTTATIAPPGQPERDVEGEAWFRTDDDARSIEWGAEGDSGYRGSLTVAEDGTGSRLTLALHSDTPHDGIEQSIDETLDRIDTLL